MADPKVSEAISKAVSRRLFIRGVIAGGRLLLSAPRQLVLPTLTVTSVLAVAFLMNYSGATGTHGLAFASTGALFPFFSALLGWLGVFLTGSDTSANALFGSLQVVTADQYGRVRSKTSLPQTIMKVRRGRGHLRIDPGAGRTGRVRSCHDGSRTIGKSR